MWTGSIEKKYGVSRKPGSKKDPPASDAKQAPTEAEHTREGGEEEEKEQDPIVQPDDVSCTSKRKRKQKEAEHREPCTTCFQEAEATQKQVVARCDNYPSREEKKAEKERSGGGSQSSRAG